MSGDDGAKSSDNQGIYDDDGDYDDGISCDSKECYVMIKELLLMIYLVVTLMVVFWVIINFI